MILRIFLATCALMAVVACSGGGGTSATSPLPDVNRARSLTGSLPPAESRAAQAARTAGILGRTDSLIVSSMYGETTHPQLPAFRIRSACQATTCTLREPQSGVSLTVRLQDLELVSSTREGVSLTKNDITLVEGGVEGAEWYGSWMRHSAFAVQSERQTVSIGGRNYRVSGRYGLMGGDLTGSLPTDVSATWRGVMVGTPATGTSAGNVLQGDAALIYTFGGGRGMLDAAFANIKDLDRLAAHSTEAVRFDDVTVESDGTFNNGLTGNRIQGGFYGPNHVEAAGVFEQSNIVGAFGARRP